MRGELDLSGSAMPVARAESRKGLEGNGAGQVLRVIATDPMAAVDMPHFCMEQGHRLLSHEQEGVALIFRIERT